MVLTKMDLYSYLNFIVNNYESLPKVIIFCKDNIFIKHLKKEKFIKLINRKVFTNLEDNDQVRRFPIYIGSSDYNYNEINNSWYKYNYPRLYITKLVTLYLWLRVYLVSLRAILVWLFSYLMFHHHPCHLTY